MKLHDTLMTAYVARFDQRVRDLAEVLHIATACSQEGKHLADGDDSRGKLLAEMVALYREQHGIPARELSSAVRAFACTSAPWAQVTA